MDDIFKRFYALNGKSMVLWQRDHKIDKDAEWLDDAIIQHEFLYHTVGCLLIGNSRLYRSDDGEPQADYERDDPAVVVVGEHTSKDILLPVVKYRACEGDLVVLIRHNFYDYCATFVSKRPLTFDWDGKVDYGFEGFNRNWVLPTYEKGCTQFSASVSDKFYFWTLCFLVQDSVRRSRVTT
jgi:hypothetical protein